MSALAVLFVGLSALGAAAFAGSDSDENGASATPGRALFQHYCASCHGWEAKGDGPVARYLATPPADLTRIAARRDGVFPEEEIGEYIDGRRLVGAHGTREMPVWGRIFGKDLPPVTREVEIDIHLRMLIDYLRSIQVVVESPRVGEPG